MLADESPAFADFPGDFVGGHVRGALLQLFGLEFCQFQNAGVRALRFLFGQRKKLRDLRKLFAQNERADRARPLPQLARSVFAQFLGPRLKGGNG